MINEWLNLVSDLRAVREFCNNNPIPSLLGIFLFIVITFTLIHFLFNEKVFPTIRGGILIESFWIRMTILGILIYFMLTQIFEKSFLLRLLIVTPLVYVVWLIYREYD